MEKSIICKIRDLQRAISLVDNDLLSRFSVSVTEAVTLCCIAEAPLITAGELSKQVNLLPPLLSRLVNRLETKKLILRKADKNDHRITRFKLTTAGETLLEKLKTAELSLPQLLQKIFAVQDLDAWENGEQSK